jgi:iron(III) transport system ATP-binding protein
VSHLVLSGLTKSFGGPPVVDRVDLAIEEGESVVLLGPSGCGKTSTLRSIAGLETPTRGRISIGERTVFDSGRGVDVPTHSRDIGMVFQSYAIWPHMSVEQNVAFPLDVMRLDAADKRSRVADALEMVGLGALATRSATALSGGQQQRVAIARALVRRSPVMLLDEPLSNLDAKLREQMRLELRKLLKQVGMTAVYVTHDQEEALMLSDRIAVMNAGRLVEVGAPRALYLRPRTLFGATFLGAAETLRVHNRRGSGVETELGELQLERRSDDIADPDHVGIRPEAIRVHPADAPAGHAAPVNSVPAIVAGVVFSGRQQQLVARTDSGREMLVLVDATRVFQAGQAVRLELPPERLMPLKEDPR